MDLSGIRLALCISDSHCGSTVGLAHPTESRNVDGNTIRLNPIQAWLWECHEHMCNEWLPSIAGGDPFVVFHNADAIDGYHHRTRQTWTTDDGAMRDCFVACYRDLADRAAAWFQTRGTECHTGESVESEAGFYLGAERHPTTGTYAPDEWRVEMCGKLISVAHHTSTTSRPYLESGVGSREVATAALAALRANRRPPDILVRAHGHTFTETQDATGMYIRLPPWQVKTRYAAKVVTNSITLPGAVLLDFRNCLPGEMPHVRKILYRPKGDAQ